MQTVRIPWAAWYGDSKFELTFPDSWKVSTAEMKGGDDIGDAGIRNAFAAPIGSPPLQELAKGRKSAAILVDDLSRPTPAYRLLPYVIEELAEAGIDEDHIRIIGAVAAHRPMDRADFIKKVGKDIVERMQVLNHNAYENLEFLGHSSRGIPLYFNRDFMACEVRIALGMITPRGGFFGGGAKLVLPGAAAHVTIMYTHRHVREGFREHLDEIARIVGLDFLVNPLLNPELEIMGLVTGDPVDAFWQGVEYGKDLYATPFPEDVDVGIFNAFPKDTELVQAGLATVPMRGSGGENLKKDATIVITTACPEGFGWHSALGPGTALGGTPSPPNRKTIIFSTGVNRWDVKLKYGDAVLFCKTWPEVIDELKRTHGDDCHAAVFPCGALQYGE